MSQLLITQAKPNPAGKDNGLGRLIPNQLAGEWIDITNVTNEDLRLNGMQVLNRVYSGLKVDWQIAYEFNLGDNDTLPAGKTVRLHSGKTIPICNLKPVDYSGTDYHLFTEKNQYIWNNKRNDDPTLYLPKKEVVIDATKYKAPVAEGKVLKRQGDFLV